MSEDFVKRPEFNKSLQWIHTRIDDIAKTTTQIEAYSKSMKESSDRTFNCVYGTNGRDGMIAKITKLCERLGLHTKLITGIILSILGIAFFVIQTFLTRGG